MAESNVAATPTAPAAEAQVQAAAPQEQKTVAKAKPQKTGDVILDTAQSVENMTKTKLLNRARELVENIQGNEFELGGVLKAIFDNGFFDPHPDFGTYVSAEFGFQERKARYLMEIYENLVTKQIPWEKVKGLGWSKLKDLARYLTKENVDEWVAKASNLSVVELQAALKAKANEGAGAESTTKATADVQKFVFKLKADQMEVVQAALSKGKAEMNTEYESVVLEKVCAGYLGGTVTAAKGPTLKEMMESMNGDYETILNTFAEVFPKVDLSVTVQPDKPADAAAAQV